jgi:NAD(P)H-binding
MRWPARRRAAGRQTLWAVRHGFPVNHDPLDRVRPDGRGDGQPNPAPGRRGRPGRLYEWIGLPLIVGAIYADKDRQEAIVTASGLNWTIVRPTLLTNGPRTGQYRVLTNLEGVQGGRMSRADCADCLMRAMVEGAWSRTAITITDADERR